MSRGDMNAFTELAQQYFYFVKEHCHSVLQGDHEFFEELIRREQEYREELKRKDMLNEVDGLAKLYGIKI